MLLRWLGLGQVSAGLIEGIGVIGVATVALLPIAMRVPQPSPAVFEEIVQVGIVLLLGYVVELVWFVQRIAQAPDYENRLGGLTGIGIAGLIGVVLAILLGAHLAAGHNNVLDDIGLAWIVPSLAFMAGVVVIQPLLVHEWDEPSAKHDAESDRSSGES